ncbi:hypothetical protein DL771_000176 [Monosporascus sp. 5C6A]|nr:hypothetical protein DL771_000176 [Monosporascus sp. 5C6A]
MKRSLAFPEPVLAQRLPARPEFVAIVGPRDHAHVGPAPRDQRRRGDRGPVENEDEVGGPLQSLATKYRRFSRAFSVSEYVYGTSGRDFFFRFAVFSS